MKLLQPFFDQNDCIILDGALATELERRGAVLNSKLWSAIVLKESPDLIRQVHYDYFAAGADIVVTATYQATFPGFEALGLSKNEAANLMQLGVQLACEARDAFWEDDKNKAGRVRPLVAASVGPYGAFLADGSEYTGDYGLSVQELMDFHRQRMEVLAESGADLLAFETIPCPEEAVALINLLNTMPAQAAWLSFSCRDDKRISQGEGIESAVALANDSPGIVAVGLNCTPPRFTESLLRRASGVTEKPLLAYPNSGEGWDAKLKCWIPASGYLPFTDYPVRWKEAGARLIGGCCRTTPEDIRQIRSKLLNK